MLFKSFIIKCISLFSVISTKNLALKDMLKEQNININDKTCAMQRMESKNLLIHQHLKNLLLLQSREVK